MTRRRVWRVASLIISTNSDLSAMARSPRNASPFAGSQSAPNCLTSYFEDASRLSELPPLPDIDKMPGNRRGRGHGRRHQMGAALEALPAFEIAVRGRAPALFTFPLTHHPPNAPRPP